MQIFLLIETNDNPGEPRRRPRTYPEKNGTACKRDSMDLYCIVVTSTKGLTS